MYIGTKMYIGRLITYDCVLMNTDTFPLKMKAIFSIIPLHKLQSDDVVMRRGMEKYFINIISPALNET